MKKFIYITGVGSTNLLLMGVLFKILHFPLAGIFITSAIALFCLVFFPAALYSSYASQPERKFKWLYITTYVVFAICLWGALFKVMHWPGAGALLLIGVPLPFVLFFPVYLYHTRNLKNQSVASILGPILGLSFIAVYSAFLALNPAAAFIDGFAVQAYNNQFTSSLIHVHGNQYAPIDGISQKAQEVEEFIERLKQDILVSTGNTPQSLSSYNDMINRNMDVSSVLLQEDMSGLNHMQKLKGLLSELRTQIVTNDGVDGDLKNLASMLLETGSDSPDSEMDWVDRAFYYKQQVVVLNLLTRIQFQVKLLQQELQR